MSLDVCVPRTKPVRPSGSLVAPQFRDWRYGTSDLTYVNHHSRTNAAWQFRSRDT